jgi:glycosyltransferase involved in cell wall biosynthesis
VFISQRILTLYREDAFYELAKDRDIEIFVAFGDRKKKKFAKYSSIKTVPRFPHSRLATISIVFELFNHVNQVFFSPGVLWQLIKFRPDVVLTEGTSNILNNLLICPYCILTGRPYIWWDLGKIRGQTSENRFRKILYPVISYLFKRAAVILGYSSYAGEYFKSLSIPSEKIVIAGNTVRLDMHLKFPEENYDRIEELKSDLGLEKRFVFLAVGGLEKAKRFDLLIKSFRQLDQDNHYIALVLVGGGLEEEHLKEMASNAKNIYFSGAQFKDVGLYFSIADVFVLPGLGGLAINEALAYGLPVISGAADGTELDLVINGQTGFLIEEDMETGLYQKMEWCIAHPAETAEMGTKGKELITTRFTLENMISNIKESIRRAHSNVKD